MEWYKDKFRISDSKNDLDLELIHQVLRSMPWAASVSIQTVARSIDQSFCMGVYRDSEQVGFGRAITDRATFAYLDDVFILVPWQGRGLSKWLLNCFLDHPELQGLRRWMLATTDAHGLYEKNGFSALSSPEWFMEIYAPADSQ